MRQVEYVFLFLIQTFNLTPQVWLNINRVQILAIPDIIELYPTILNGQQTIENPMIPSNKLYFKS